MSAAISLLMFIGTFLIFAMLFRMPVAHSLGAASLMVFITCNLNTITVGQAAFNSLDSFAFLAIPFYIYAGTIMEHSGISKTLIDWLKGLIGRVRGALGIICTLASMAFGVLTGSAMATISAIGKVMAPEMEKEGYPPAYTSALLSATCFLGILIPPSVPGIMYALSAGEKISDVWMVTVGPALIFAVGYMIVNYLRIGRKIDKASLPAALSSTAYLKNLGKSTLNAIPAIMMPVIIYGCIYGGVLVGVSLGWLLREEATTGGTELGGLRYSLLDRDQSRPAQEDHRYFLAGRSYFRYFHRGHRPAQRICRCFRQGPHSGWHLQLPVRGCYLEHLQPCGIPDPCQRSVPVHGNVHGYQRNDTHYDSAAAARGKDLRHHCDPLRRDHPC